MPGQTMYFGTKERMAWVKCPAINADISKVGWSASGSYLNGGAFVRKSSTGHKEYGFTWNLAKQAELDTFLDYGDGLYGDGPFYFLDPFAQKKNLFPQYWAAPRLAAEDAPLLVKGQTPTLTNTTSNTTNLPTMSAQYTCHYGDLYSSIWFPIPTGYALNLGVFGTATGLAQAVVIPDGGAAPVTTVRTQLVKNPNSATTPRIQTGFATGGVGSSVLTAGSGENGSYAGVWTWTTAATGGSSTHYVGGVESANDINVVAATVVSGSIVAKPSVARSLAQGGLQARIDFFTSAGAAVGSAVVGTAVDFTAGQQTRIYVNGATVPATATRARLGVQVANHAGTTNGWTLTVSRPVVEVAATAGGYVDGSLSDANVSDTTSVHYAWTGAVNASTSTETSTVVAGQVALTMLANNTSSNTNYALSGVSGATVTFRGYNGTLTLAGMLAQVRLIGESVPLGNFISGKGNSGVRFKDIPSVQGYSSPDALDFVSASATLIETGAWED